MSSTSTPVSRIRDAVQIARDIEAIDGRELLADPATTPDPAVARMRDRLQRRRQRATLRHRHRAARRRERAEDFAQEMADRGRRALRARQLAISPARRAANLDRLQSIVILVALPVIMLLGAASTTAVHAFMVRFASASATVAWAVEPAIIALVSGVIITRAIMRRNGAVVPGSLAWIERGALTASVVMCWLGSGPGAIVAPVGAAVVALAVERITDGIADADLGEPGPVLLDEGQGAEVAEEHAPAAPYWEQLADGRRVRRGGEHIAGWVPASGRPLLPLECAARARARARVLAEGARAVAALEDWRGRERAASTRTRVRAESLTAAAGGAPRALPRSEHTVSDQRSARTDQEHGHRQERGAARIDAAAEARRRAGQSTRERIVAHIAEHPEHEREPERIAEHVGVHVTTVRRHLRAIRQD
ncbi:hypothetical protein [Nocardiopsis sp. FR26]|uniref:hypothetical protein n=1 Tax=Nocardiopsis sp. FR26 TaxID=2605987 RepID=UPI00135CBA59|nr:hypothetical protein [Nocardiopsis sp. FR26]